MTSIIVTSAETIANNTDLLTQILIRLPTKTLLALKGVSKQWFFLISDPYFCLCHTRHHQKNGLLRPTDLLLSWYNTLPYYRNNLSNIIVLQSCYGLFLCQSAVEVDDFSSYFVCNPTTKKFKKIFFPRESFQHITAYVNMAFDPLKSPHYKIICVRKLAYAPPKHKHELDIYSSETDSWSLSKISFEVNIFIDFGMAIFCNGKIHWNGRGEDLLYFDVENEKLETLPVPLPRVERQCSYLGECGGVLYIAVIYSLFERLEFDVFEMASDYSHWFLKYRLNLGDLVEYFLEVGSFYWTVFSDVCIIQFEKEEEPKVVVWIGTKLKFYDWMDGTWKSIDDLRPHLSTRVCVFPYRSIHASLHFENISSIC